MTAVTVSTPRPIEDYLNSFKENGRKVKQIVVEGFRDIVTQATHIKDDSTAHVNLWKSVPAGLTALGNQSLLLGPAGSAVRFIEGWQLFGDISDFASGKMQADPWILVAQRIFFAFSNLGTTVVWAVQLGVVSLGAGIVNTFAGLSTGGATIGFGIGAVSALYTLATLGDHKYSKEIRNKAILDVIANVSGAALTAIAFVGVTISPVAIALLILTSSGFGILSFCYSKKHAKAFYQDKNDVPPSIWTTASNFVNNTEALEKIAKLFNKLADGASDLGVVALVKESKCFVEFHEVLNLPKRLYEWFVPSKVVDANGNTVKDANGNAKMRYSWEGCSSWKLGNKVFLTALSVVAVVAFIVKYKLIELSILASLAAATIGGVSFLAFAANATYCGYTGCNTVDGSINLANEYRSDAAPASGDKADIAKWKKAQKQKMFNVQKKLAKWEAINESLTKAKTPVAQKQAARADVALSRSKRIRKMSSESGKAALRKMSVEEYTAKTLERLNTRYVNADTRCKKAGLNIIAEGTKFGGGSLFLSAMFLTTAVSAPVMAGVLTAATGLALVGAFMGVIKVVKDEDFKKVLVEPKFVA